MLRDLEQGLQSTPATTARETGQDCATLTLALVDSILGDIEDT
jgi:hypothetical protein